MLVLLATGALVATLDQRIAAETFLIPAPDRADMVHDPVRQIVYITSGSEVLRFNLVTKQFLPPFQLGGKLLGIDISADARWLAVADNSSVRLSPDSFGPRQIWFYLVDLQSGAAERVMLPLSSAAFAESGTYSVAFGADGSVFSTARFAGSGSVLLRRYRPDTRTATTILTVNQDTMLAATPDRSIIVFAEADIAPGGWGAVRVSDGQILHRWDRDQGTPGPNRDVAINRTGTQIAIAAVSLYTFDAATLTRTRRFQARHPVGILGAVYHPHRDVLYVSVSGYHDIRAFDTNTFTEVARYTTPEAFSPVFMAGYNNGRLKMSQDGRLLFVNVAGGVRYMTDAAVIEETDGAVAYSGRWNTFQCAGCTGSTLRYSAEPGARATISFTGSGVRWTTATATLGGRATVYVDGVFRTSVDLYSPTTTLQVQHEIGGLTPGRHSVTLEVAGTRHPNAIGTAVAVDAFEVIP